MKKVSTHVNLDRDLLEWVQEQAKLHRCPVSQVIRTLIAEAMRKEQESK